MSIIKSFLSLVCATTSLTAATTLPQPLHEPNTPHLPSISEKPPASFTWSSVRIGGEEYIPFSALKTFYFLNTESIDGKTITLKNKRVTATFTTGAHPITINGVKMFLSEPIRLKDDQPHLSRLDLITLIEPVLRPSYIKWLHPVRTVILDPGHGGKDKGSAGLEAGYTLAVMKLAREMLVKKGYQVVLTRENDGGVPMGKRIKIINATEDAVLISLHFNAGGKTVHGMETYILSAHEKHPGLQASAALAVAVHSRCLSFANIKHGGNDFILADRGIRHAAFRLLKDSKHPAILIEAGFLTHQPEAKNIASPAYQKLLASGITRGIDVYNNSISRGMRR